MIEVPRRNMGPLALKFFASDSLTMHRSTSGARACSILPRPMVNSYWLEFFLSMTSIWTTTRSTDGRTNEWPICIQFSKFVLETRASSNSSLSNRGERSKVIIFCGNNFQRFVFSSVNDDHRKIFPSLIYPDVTFRSLLWCRHNGCCLPTLAISK